MVFAVLATALLSPLGTTLAQEPTTTAAGQTPQVTLSPTSGPPGTQVVVTGTGWPAGPVDVVFQLPGVANPPTVAQAAAVNGTFNVTFQVPDNAPQGQQQVGFRSQNAVRIAQFTVTARPSGGPVTGAPAVPPPTTQPPLTTPPPPLPPTVSVPGGPPTQSVIVAGPCPNGEPLIGVAGQPDRCYSDFLKWAAERPIALPAPGSVPVAGPGPDIGPFTPRGIGRDAYGSLRNLFVRTLLGVGIGFVNPVLGVAWNIRGLEALHEQGVRDAQVTLRFYQLIQQQHDQEHVAVSENFCRAYWQYSTLSAEDGYMSKGSALGSIAGIAGLANEIPGLSAAMDAALTMARTTNPTAYWRNISTLASTMWQEKDDYVRQAGCDKFEGDYRR